MMSVSSTNPEVSDSGVGEQCSFSVWHEMSMMRLMTGKANFWIAFMSFLSDGVVGICLDWFCHWLFSALYVNDVSQWDGGSFFKGDDVFPFVYVAYLSLDGLVCPSVFPSVGYEVGDFGFRVFLLLFLEQAILIVEEVVLVFVQRPFFVRVSGCFSDGGFVSGECGKRGKLGGTFR